MYYPGNDSICAFVHGIFNLISRRNALLLNANPATLWREDVFFCVKTSFDPWNLQVRNVGFPFHLWPHHPERSLCTHRPTHTYQERREQEQDPFIDLRRMAPWVRLVFFMYTVYCVGKDSQNFQKDAGKNLQLFFWDWKKYLASL